ncbi:menaquinone biosynthesis protein [Brevibacillus dissolubilis]|uniref:menaquinone biosynthesis protein n=1 Tax=Brevibacillus dissolubilis TaxID=1844116 RepID=UPI00111674C5|nr:menaquinone biosynthesis protein [Brevibacillus dissolubilis]
MSQKALKIGQISYTNTLPVTYYFDQERFRDQVDFIEQVPAQLNLAMSRGEIHIGPISAFSYAEHADSYLVLPDLSVSAKRRVGSLFIFSKKPIEELDGARVALTNTSATSINLTKIILQKFHGHTVTYDMCAPVLADMMKDHEVAVLIGDEALLAYRNNKEYHVYDLGELWNDFTGYPLTTALWTVRKDALAEHADLVAQIHTEFLASKQKSMQSLDDIVRHCQGHFGGDEETWTAYFRGLGYDLSPVQIEGLEYFFACAAELGLLAGPVKVVQWEAGAKATPTT